MKLLHLWLRAFLSLDRTLDRNAAREKRVETLEAELSRLTLRVSEIHAEHDLQLSQLRALITHDAKQKPPDVKVARRMSEVRNFLQQGDEDAA